MEMKTPQKQPNEAEIGNLPENNLKKKIRIMIVKMIQDLGENNGEDERNVY